MITRATEDVEIPALRDWEVGIDLAFPLPEAPEIAAAQVADELNLGGKWLTSGA